MSRYMVERTFPDGLEIPMTEEGAATCLTVVDQNAEPVSLGAFICQRGQDEWLYCIYDGTRIPRASARRHSATELPLDR